MLLWKFRCDSNSCDQTPVEWTGQRGNSAWQSRMRIRFLSLMWSLIRWVTLSVSKPRKEEETVVYSYYLHGRKYSLSVQVCVILQITPHLFFYLLCVSDIFQEECQKKKKKEETRGDCISIKEGHYFVAKGRSRQLKSGGKYLQMALLPDKIYMELHFWVWSHGVKHFSGNAALRILCSSVSFLSHSAIINLKNKLKEKPLFSPGHLTGFMSVLLRRKWRWW